MCFKTHLGAVVLIQFLWLRKQCNSNRNKVFHFLGSPVCLRFNQYTSESRSQQSLTASGAKPMSLLLSSFIMNVASIKGP